MVVGGYSGTVCLIYDDAFNSAGSNFCNYGAWSDICHVATVPKTN